MTEPSPSTKQLDPTKPLTVRPLSPGEVDDAQSACLDCPDSLSRHCTELQAALCKTRLDHEAALKADAGKERE
jgi:hypothetical protein